MSRARQARAILSLYQYARDAPATVLAKIDSAMTAAVCLDYAARLRDYGTSLTPGLAKSFAEQAGIGATDLRLRILPLLRQAGVVEYTYTAGELTHIEEYVGLGKSVLDQLVDLFESLTPSSGEYATVSAVQLASYAPLTTANHLDSLVRLAGHSDEEAKNGLLVARAAGAVQRVASPELREEVVYNPPSGALRWSAILPDSCEGSRQASVMR